MPILATFRRIESLSEADLQKLGRQLSAMWIARGRPDFEDMGASWRFEYARVAAEFQRRGTQLRLF